MYLVLIFIPLLGSILSGFFGRKIGIRGTQWITCSIIITVISYTVVFTILFMTSVSVTFELFTWTHLVSAVYDFIPVWVIYFLVLITSIGYMSNGPHNQRFFSYLSLFTFMMIILVTANNYLLVFLSWIGNCFLTIDIFAMLWLFGGTCCTNLVLLTPYTNENMITLVGVYLLIGTMVKTIKVGSDMWLPIALQRVTYVPILIHAATMVIAGVYLLMHLSPLIEYSSTVLLLCLWIGALITVFSSLIGLFQQNIKNFVSCFIYIESYRLKKSDITFLDLCILIFILLILYCFFENQYILVLVFMSMVLYINIYSIDIFFWKSL